MVDRYFEHDGLRFRYLDVGEGIPFVFQHGLGGDATKPYAVVSPPSGFRQLGFDARGHGETRPLGDPERIGIEASAEDLSAFLTHLGLDRAIVGGISMGAAIALNFAIRYPERVLGLVLVRPAWLDEPFPPNTRVFPKMAALIREFGAREAANRFRQTTDYLDMLRDSPDCASALIGHFEDPRAEDSAIRLERIPRGTPARSVRDYQSIRAPTLVVGNHQDPIHPWEFAIAAANAVTGARFREVTPKSVDVERHAADVQAAVTEFFADTF